MSSRPDGLDAWRAAIRARDAREQEVEKAVDALIQAGLDGALTWAHVDDALTALGYGQEPEWADPDGIGDHPASTEFKGARQPPGWDQSMEVER